MSSEEKPKIVRPNRDRVMLLGSWVDDVLEAIGRPEAFVSDGSMVDDFRLSHEEMLELSLRLDLEVSRFDYIVDVAERLREKSNEQ